MAKPAWVRKLYSTELMPLSLHLIDLILYFGQNTVKDEQFDKYVAENPGYRSCGSFNIGEIFSRITIWEAYDQATYLLEAAWDRAKKLIRSAGLHRMLQVKNDMADDLIGIPKDDEENMFRLSGLGFTANDYLIFYKISLQIGLYWPPKITEQIFKSVQHVPAHSRPDILLQNVGWVMVGVCERGTNVEERLDRVLESLKESESDTIEGVLSNSAFKMVDLRPPSEFGPIEKSFDAIKRLAEYMYLRADKQLADEILKENFIDEFTDNAKDLQEIFDQAYVASRN